MPSRYYSAIAQDTTVTSGITSSSTTVAVAATTGFPTNYPFTLALDYNQVAEELVDVTGVSGLTLTITRGVNGTTAVAHAAGAVVRHVISARDLSDAQTHYDATTAHGVTGAVVGTASTQILTNKDLTSATNTFPTTLATLTGSQTLTNKTMDYNSNTFLNLPTNSGPTGPTGPTGATGATGSSANLNLTLNAQTGTTYTLVASDLNKLVTLSNSGGITLTIPSGVFTTGQQVNIQAIGAGQVTIQGDGTSTFTGTGTKLRAQYSAATIVCTGSNTFTIVGDLA